MKKAEIKIVIEGMPSDGGQVRADAFLQSLLSITGNLKKADKSLSSGISSFYLRINDLSYHSPATVIMEAIPYIPEKDIRFSAINKFCSTYKSVLDGTLANQDIDYSFIESLEDTAKYIGRSVNCIRIMALDYDLSISNEFKSKLSLALAPEDKSVGHVRGMLEYLNIHQDKNLFRIYPDIGPTKISCHFPDNLTSLAISAIGKYIEVKGELWYKAISKYPNEVIVEEIEIFPDEKEIPSLLDLRGIAPDLTGKLSSEQYVRKIRNAQVS